jgi:hypothetical protein
MPTPTFLKPKQPRNLRATGIVALVMLLAWAVPAWLWVWSPKRGFGLAFGILASLSFVFLMAYPSRRPRAWPMGTAQRWIQSHVYVGILAMLAVWLHVGFRWPTGTMGWWLLLLSLWTTASGLVGVVLQKWIPAGLAQGLKVEALYDRIPELVRAGVEEADALVSESGDAVKEFYNRDIRRSLGQLAPSWSYLLDVRAGRNRAIEPFLRLSRFVDEEEQARVKDLMSIYMEKLELDAQFRLQGLLRSWLMWHTPPAALLMTLMLVHILAWIWY